MHRAGLGCKDDNYDDGGGTALAATAAAAVVVVDDDDVDDDDYGGDHDAADDAVADNADDHDENVAGDVGLTSLVGHWSFDHCGNPVRCVAFCGLCIQQQHVPSLPWWTDVFSVLCQWKPVLQQGRHAGCFLQHLSGSGGDGLSPNVLRLRSSDGKGRDADG